MPEDGCLKITERSSNEFENFLFCVKVYNTFMFIATLWKDYKGLKSRAPWTDFHRRVTQVRETLYKSSKSKA